MRTAVAISIIMMTSACNSAAEKAEKRFAIIDMAGTDAERCEAASKVAAEWLDREEAEKYRQWSAKKDLYCNPEPRNAPVSDEQINAAARSIEAAAAAEAAK